MAYDIRLPTSPCPVCSSAANFSDQTYGIGQVVDCSRCGHFVIPFNAYFQNMLPFSVPKEQALASYLIQRSHQFGKVTVVTGDLFKDIKQRSLPSPAEALDIFLLYLAEVAEGRPGNGTEVNFFDPSLLGRIGALSGDEIDWIVHTLSALDLINLSRESIDGSCVACVTYRGWQRVEDLKTAKIASRFAFFARKFSNPDLDSVFERCLKPAVEQTGYELRTVTQRAGLIDAIVEDEIRRCRFLIGTIG